MDRSANFSILIWKQSGPRIVGLMQEIAFFNSCKDMGLSYSKLEFCFRGISFQSLHELQLLEIAAKCFMNCWAMS
ncbi:hypothetical protein PGB90_000729 [Kerria lacca]